MATSIKRYVYLVFFVLCLSIVAAKVYDPVQPPKAKKEDMSFTEHGRVRHDPYHWLKNRDTAAVLTYLDAENKYTDSKMEHTLALQKELETEFKNRIKEDDNSVPYREGNYFYYTRYEKNKIYPLYCRKKDNLNSPEEIMLDVNELAKGQEYYSIEKLKISPDENLLAFAEDTQGRRNFKIRIKDLAKNAFLNDAMLNTSDSLEWANDSANLFYAVPDPVTLRVNRVFQHRLGSLVDRDKLVYDEKDDTYFCEVSKSKSQQYLFIISVMNEPSEFHYLDANHPDESFKLFAKRKEGYEYNVEHLKDKFLIRTNEGAPDFRLMQCGLDKTDAQFWQPYITPEKNTYLSKFEVFDTFLALEQRKNGLVELKIYPFDKQAPYYIDLAEPDYDAAIVKTPAMSSHDLRFTFSSLRIPTTIYDYNVVTKHKTVKKQDEILGEFDSKNYQTQRVFASAKDGTQVPISLVYRSDKFKPHQNPLLMLGYGSYGVTSDSTFNPYVISLLDRGFVYAIAHIRGGGELGADWYLRGKLLNKKNTFTDFIDAAEYLEKSGFGAAGNLYARGRSAGGLLMGAIVNMAPQLFNGVIAEVPFVDVMNTMMDSTIPLTTAEYPEWGNPNEKIYYDYMISYSPYDNVIATAYPNLLVVAGYHDPHVQYWESAKWVAKLRDTKTDDHLLLLRTNMSAGHSGASDRFETYREMAFEYAFLLSLVETTKAPPH